MMQRTIGLIVFAAAPLLVPAQRVAEENSHYFNARTYLRTAQMLIRVPERPNVQLTLKPADEELDAAIREIDRAGVAGHTHAGEQPAAKGNLEDVDRFNSIVDLLHAARYEIQQEADHTQVEWKIAAVKHIGSALKSVHKAAIDAGLDRQIGDY